MNQKYNVSGVFFVQNHAQRFVLIYKILPDVMKNTFSETVQAMEAIHIKIFHKDKPMHG